MPDACEPLLQVVEVDEEAGMGVVGEERPVVSFGVFHQVGAEQEVKAHYLLELRPPGLLDVPRPVAALWVEGLGRRVPDLAHGLSGVKSSVTTTGAWSLVPTSARTREAVALAASGSLARM